VADFVDDVNRQVVPRWRPFRIAADMGEVAGIGATTVERPTPSPGELETLIGEWKTGPTPATASELVDAGLVLGSLPVAREAAEWLLRRRDTGELSSQLAKAIIMEGGDSPSPPEPPLVTSRERFRRVARLRRLLANNPRNPIAWVDLAREYSILGHNSHAERAIRTAIGLDPSNRFVIRSASRFYLHVQEPERAHHVVRVSPSVRRDPWLVAAEIVSAEIAERPSKLLKHAREVLEARSYSPLQLSELAGALATREHWSGSQRIARRHLKQALVDPTENTVAQAAWLSRHGTAVSIAAPAFAVPRAFEAATWSAMQSGQHARALSYAQAWQRDEPFSGRAATTAGWIASVGLGDFDQAIEAIKVALPSNPGSPRLLANYFYALACSGRVPEAAATLAELEAAGATGIWDTVERKVLLEADRGLLAFRSGRLERGVEHYTEAMALAEKAGLSEIRAHAFLNFMMESVRANPGQSIDEEALSRAVEACGASTRSAFAAFAERIVSLRAQRRNG
jgi:tetratricopeptide (TPR) repeat protein